MKKLLIIDDSEDLLEAMAFFLQKRGFEVKVQSDPHNIINIINTYRPDLIILDIKMKNKDGRLLCKEIRENTATKNACILMFSSSPKLLEDYKSFGADGILEKPFGLETLERTIESVIKICNGRVVI